MSRFSQLAARRTERHGGAVPVHRQRRQPGRQSDPADQRSTSRASAERYDIVVDFSSFRGRRHGAAGQHAAADRRAQPDRQRVAGRRARAAMPNDPVVGPILEFRVVSSVQSVDVPGVTLYARPTPDPSQVPAVLTAADPDRHAGPRPGRRVRPRRRRRLAPAATASAFPTARRPRSSRGPSRSTARQAHSMNANRISLLIPKPGEIEHWTYVNGGGGWDHPIHLHFEEGITMNRGSDADPGHREAGPQGRVAAAARRAASQFQVQFGEYGGSYVNHCHNTVHEDFAMLMRIQLLTGSARIAADRGHADAEPDARRRDLHDAGNPARRRSRGPDPNVFEQRRDTGENDETGIHRRWRCPALLVAAAVAVAGFPASAQTMNSLTGDPEPAAASPDPAPHPLRPRAGRPPT